jgi:hypothetical protein
MATWLGESQRYLNAAEKRKKLLVAVGIQPQFYGHLAHSLATNTAILTSSFFVQCIS